MSKLGRRKLLGGLLTGTAAATVAAPAYAKGKRRLKMVTTWPKNFPGLGTAPENIAKRVREMTDGEIDIKIYAAGELVGAFDSFDAVSTGTADMYNGAEYYW
jgi:TRAP-type mannitol/chloroaromatic compound transport system substrate-binding protein